MTTNCPPDHFPLRYRIAWRLATLALLVATTLAGEPGAALASEKIALVVGNSAYLNVPSLPNPVNDAADMARSLERLGFAVKHVDNLDYNRFRLALIEFGNRAKSADKAVIFYAGHGVEIDGKNWLIPVDAEVKSELDVYAEAINLETLIDISVLPRLIGLVILDACRNDPFAATNAAAGRALPRKPGGRKTDKSSRASAKREPTQSAPIETSARGLAPVEINDNVLVAFAAAAGTTANDGTGRNSPYSGSLLRHVETPGLEINYLFRTVHDDVLRETKTQEPAVYGSLSSEEIYLKGDAPTANADSEAERLAWAFVRTTSEIATLRRFSDQFPASRYTAELRDRIAQLEGAENLAWTIVRRQNAPNAYKAFIELYPYGNQVESARLTLTTLETLASLETNSDGNPSDASTVDLLPPPPASYELASLYPDATTRIPESIEKAWGVLRESRDDYVIGKFIQKYPSQRNNRVPRASDVGLRTVSSTEWLMRTAGDEEVNSCFAGDAAACASAASKYPDFAQLRFQLCRVKGRPGKCMQDAVEDARQRGLLVSAYTRSEKEKARNREYRQAVARVQENVGKVIGNVVSQTVSNAVQQAVGRAVAAAAAGAAATAASNAAAMSASRAASTAASTAAASAASSAAAVAAARAASSAASNAAGKAASTAASAAASRAASTTASNAANRAASNAASRAASNAASRAASNAASNAASRAASSAASRAASTAAKAASDAAANAASRIPSDIRLKRDIRQVGITTDGFYVYRYRYLGDREQYVGVMAQEVMQRMPEAVSRSEDGTFEVDYALLGLEFLTFRDWKRRHSGEASR